MRCRLWDGSRFLQPNKLLVHLRYYHCLMFVKRF
jgi:hypothetical protein